MIFVVINFLKKIECDDERGTRAEQHARNPRETQTRITRGTRAKRRRAEPARTINTCSSRSRNSSSSSTSSSSSSSRSSSRSSRRSSSSSCCCSRSSSSRGGGQDGAKMPCIAWSCNKNYHAYMELLFGIYGRCFLAVGDILWAYSRRFATATARTASLGSHSRGMIQEVVWCCLAPSNKFESFISIISARCRLLLSGRSTLAKMSANQNR